MIVSWKWLGDYVDAASTTEEVTRRLTMSGLNHESTVPAGDDFAIDLEVTSNRPDCLGHIGIAREIAALFHVPLNVRNPVPEENAEQPAESLIRIRIEAPQLCSLYTGRVIRGVKLKSSPKWMQDRLQTAGINPVNNIVDCTNYVMLECGQPLHAFDLANIRGREIIVRQPKPGEKITAIDHREYTLQPGMCIIADGQGPVAIAGVMGGAESEVSTDTVDVLIESAIFGQQPVRNAARQLNLHSPSSFRFERGVSAGGTDWASRRCCQLILELAGGKLATGAVVAGSVPNHQEPIVLRQSRITEVLGVEIPAKDAEDILERLGVVCVERDHSSWFATAPSWRADLQREIDLIEEIGRITGYDSVPDVVIVPMVATTRQSRSRVAGLVRSVMTGAGFDEAMTPSLTPAVWSELFTPWTDSPPLQSSQPMLGVLEKASQNIGSVEFARRSLVPSLMEARRINEYRGNLDADLFELAHVYLPTDGDLPNEPWLLSFVGGRSFPDINGVVQKLVQTVCPQLELEIHDCDLELLDPTLSCEFRLGDRVFGWGGVVSDEARKSAGLKNPAGVAELNVSILLEQAVLVRRQKPVSNFPSVSRDFNFVVPAPLRWVEIEKSVRAAGGKLLESVVYRETFRDEKRDGENRKRILLGVVLRSQDGTLSGEEAERVCKSIIARCEQDHQAKLA